MKREREFQAWLQISQGCNCRCSYCIVPSTRGREQSRDPARAGRRGRAPRRRRRPRGDAARPEREQLRPRPAARDADHASPSCSRAVDAIDGIERIRYTSPHPKDMREDVIRAHAELPALCEHIHLPLQSGSSRILKAMRRTYNRERYLDRVALIREHVPDCALTTDIIVGFPGETDEDFERDARGRRGGRLRRRLHLRLLAAARDRGGDAGRPGPARGQARAHGAPGRGGPAPRPRALPALRRPHDGGAGRGHRAAPTRRRLRGRTRHNKAVNFEGTAAAGRAGRGRDRPPRPRRR